MAKHKLRVGYAGVSLKAFFAEEHHYRERSISGLEQLAAEWDFDFFPVREELTTQSDSVRAANYLRAKEIDFLLIQNSTVSMGEQLLPLVDVAPRLGLWALPDPVLEGPIQIHALVALNEYASILKRYLRAEDIPFKWFYDHVDTEMFRARFGVTVRALTAVKNMERTRVGWVGGLSPGFYNMMVDERLLHHRLGVQIGSHEMGELVRRAESYEMASVAAVAKQIRGAATEVKVSSSKAFERVTRLYLALKDLAQEHDYDTLAVQCWPKAQELYAVAPCMAYSWLGSEDGVAVSCEGDVQGAISMHLLNLLTGASQSATLLDMTALDPQTAYMMMFHCGVSPRHFANDEGIRWVDHVTLGRKSTAGPYGVAGDQVFAPQENISITYVGDNGGSLLVLGSHIVEHTLKGFDGTRGWFADFELNKESIDVWDLLNTIFVRGQEHHYAIGIGDVTSELLEFAAWKKLHLIEKVPYADYLQREGVNV